MHTDVQKGPFNWRCNARLTPEFLYKPMSAGYIHEVKVPQDRTHLLLSLLFFLIHSAASGANKNLRSQTHATIYIAVAFRLRGATPKHGEER